MTYVPFISSTPEVVRKMLEIAEVCEGEIVYDLGSGDGRILVSAAKDFGAKKAVGVEIREDLIENTYDEIKRRRLEDRIVVIHGDIYNVPVEEADVVTLFLTTLANERLRPKLEKELKDCARIVSHDYEVSGWTPTKTENMDQHRIYLYIFNRQSK